MKILMAYFPSVDILSAPVIKMCKAKEQIKMTIKTFLLTDLEQPAEVLWSLKEQCI
jgi:hypothetical protein